MTPGVFPPNIVAAAIASARTWRIPASVTLAQWAVESAWGRAMSGKNNPFGIKGRPPAPCTPRMTREVIGGRTVHETQYFADYSGVTEAFGAHAKLLATGAPYARARSVLPDAEAFARALTGVYATDPHYGDTLVGVMRNHDLADYDKPGGPAVAAVMAAARPLAPAPTPPAAPAPAPAPPATSWWRRLFGRTRSV